MLEIGRWRFRVDLNVSLANVGCEMASELMQDGKDRFLFFSLMLLLSFRKVGILWM